MGIQQQMWRNEALRDTFHQAVHVSGDVEAALAVAAADCVLLNVPIGTGAGSTDELRRYLTEDVVPHRPADLDFRRVTRTVDQRRVVEETMVGFTHDRELPWLLPGIEPTGRGAEVLAVSIVTFRHRSHLGGVESRIAAHRTLWDHAGLLAQLGVDPASPALRQRAGA